ncbi:hypothetical protein [Sediminibacterium sp.]|uniref:hypothetical protein n=1 Tax=Sediminibacterium sp. TaxID=1917865 RepID=UPI003F6E76ED
MIIVDILKKQIAISYPKANTKTENELIGIDIESCGRLYVKKNLEIHILFNEQLHTDESIVNLFFTPRIYSEYMRIYFSKSKFQAYRKSMGIKPKGKLEMAMEYFLVFKNMHDALLEFNSYK